MEKRRLHESDGRSEQRADALAHQAGGTLTLEQAATILHRGAAGRPPANRTDGELRERLVLLAGIELDPVAWRPVVVWRSPYDRIVAAATEAPPLELLEGGAG